MESQMTLSGVLKNTGGTVKFSMAQKYLQRDPEEEQNEKRQKQYTGIRKTIYSDRLHNIIGQK